MNETERRRILEAAIETIAAELPEAWALYVYGSFARGDEWPSSDLDLALLLPPGAAIPDLLGLIAAVSRRVGRDVDIVNLREVNLDLVMEVFRDGEQLLVRKPSEVLGWEAEKMTDFALFNPRRADILAQYLTEPLVKRS